MEEDMTNKRIRLFLLSAVKSQRTFVPRPLESRGNQIAVQDCSCVMCTTFVMGIFNRISFGQCKKSRLGQASGGLRSPGHKGETC